MSFDIPFEVAGSQQLGSYSVESSDNKLIVNGPDLKMCQEIAQALRDGKKVTMKENNKFLFESNATIDSNKPSCLPKSLRSIVPQVSEDAEERSLPANSKSGKSKPPKGKTAAQKIKTEPGNSWFQFCRFKKNQVMMESGDKASYNQKEVQLEWKGMSTEEKAFFVELAQAEKKALGGNYRAGRMRKKKQKGAASVSEDQIKKSRVKKIKAPKKVVISSIECKEDPSMEAVKFLSQLEKLDEEIEIQEKKNDALVDELKNVKVGFAVNQCKLDQKSLEAEKSLDKFNVLLKQHACCKLE